MTKQPNPASSLEPVSGQPCCNEGFFGDGHECLKQPDAKQLSAEELAKWPWNAFPEKYSVWECCLKEYQELKAENERLREALAEIVQRSGAIHGLSTDKNLSDIAREALNPKTTKDTE